MLNKAQELPLIPRFESPLVALRPLLAPFEQPSNEFSMREAPDYGLCILRCSPTDTELLSLASSVIGASVPVVPNTMSVGNGVRVMWLGPDEWLVQSHSRPAAAVESALRDALGARKFSVTDVSSGYTTLWVSGSQVPLVLARGCPLDLREHVFPEGRCAQSLYFKSPVVIAAEADRQFQLIIRRSFAEYFVQMLLDALKPIQEQQLAF